MAAAEKEDRGVEGDDINAAESLHLIYRFARDYLVAICGYTSFLRTALGR